MALLDENAYIKIMKIGSIILAAGQGTRLKSASPKPLHRIGGRPMLAWSLDAAIAVGASRIVTVLPRQSEQIQEWLGGHDFCIQDKPLGTGHAVLAAASLATCAHGGVAQFGTHWKKSSWRLTHRSLLAQHVGPA